MLDLMRATVGTKTYYFKSRAENYEVIGATVGIEEASETEQEEPTFKVEELQGKGILFRLSARLANGRTRQVLCTRTNLIGALDAIPDAGTIDGQVITSLVVARKAKFS